MSAAMRTQAAAGLKNLTSVTSLATRLPAAVIAVSLVSLVATIIVAVSTGRDLGRNLVDDRLKALQANGAFDVAAQMNSLARSTRSLASSPQTAVAIDEFAEAHRELLSLPSEDLEQETTALITALTDEYLEPLEEIGRDIELRDIASQNSGSIYLQYHYAVDLGVLNDPASVDDAGDGSRWSEIHEAVHPVYREVVNQRDLVDLLLVEPEDGYVVYSVRKRPGIGTSLRVGPFSGSVPARAFDRVVDDPSQPVVIGDLDFYAPSLGDPVGAVASPVMDGDRLAGVVIALYDSAPISGILNADGNWGDAGFPPTGKNYLFGEDGTTRSDPRTFVEDAGAHLDASVAAGVLDEAQREVIEAGGTTVLVQPVVGSTLNASRQGDTTVQTRATMTGTEAFSAVTRVPLEGLDWFVASEFGAAAAEGDFDEFAELLIVGTAIFIVMLAFVTVVWANRIVAPIRAISELLSPDADTGTRIEVPTRSPIEFHELARSFESMSAVLGERWSSLAEARDERLRLLRSMLPPGVADRVAQGEIQSLDQVPQATIVVIAVLGLDAVVRAGGPSSNRETVDLLLAELDELAESHGLARVRVLGDAYFASCGHDRPYIDHAPRAVAFTIDAQNSIREIDERDSVELDASVGVHTGPVTVGMTGASRLLYDVWGPTVSSAHHLARQADRGEILVSEQTRVLLPETMAIEPGAREGTFRVLGESTARSET